MIDTKKRTKAQLAGFVEALESNNRTLHSRLTLQQAAHDREVASLKKQLQLDELKMKGQIVDSAAHLIQALARMIGGPGF